MSLSSSLRPLRRLIALENRRSGNAILHRNTLCGVNLQKRYAVSGQESLPCRAMQQDRVRSLVGGAGLFALVVGQTLLPGLFMLTEAHADEAAKAAAVKRLIPKWFAQAQIQERTGNGSKPGRIKPSDTLECAGGDCEVTVKALDLKHTPSEKELRKAGQLGGALTPLRAAEPPELEARLNRALKAMGIAAGLASQVPEDKPAGKTVAYAKKKLKKAKDINQSFGEAIQEWNKHNFRIAAKMFEKHLKDYPDSPWAGEAALHLGCDAKYNGRFAEAQATYNTILQSTSPSVSNSAARIERANAIKAVGSAKSATNAKSATSAGVVAQGDWLASALRNNTAPEAIIDAAEDKTDYSFDIHQKAKARWADLDLATGRLDDAAAKLRDIIATDTDWRRKTWAQSWLGNVGMYKNNARDLRACGSQALSVVLASLGNNQVAAKLAILKPTSREGFTLAELSQLARKNGVPMRGFKAPVEELAQLPLPFIIHYDFDRDFAYKNSFYGGYKIEAALSGKVKSAKATSYKIGPRAGHFLVVKNIDQAQQKVTIFDPQTQRLYYLSYGQLAKEWSGQGLVLAKSLPKGDKALLRVSWLDEKAMRKVIGGCCGSFSAPPGTGCNGNNQGCNGSCGGGASTGGNPAPTSGGPTLIVSGYSGSSAKGAPVISVNRTNLNIYIKDTPMWYAPAKGPPVEITMSYNSQDSLTQNSAFGNKWMFNYASYIVEDTTYGGGQVLVFMPDGHQDAYIPNGSGGYNPPAGSHNVLTKTGSTHYELTFAGGDKAIYDIPAGTTSLQPFLVELRDRFANSLTFGYNADVRLTTITDAQNNLTRLAYDAVGHIIGARDPFGRQASFSYDANNNMVEAVDMEGHAFQYVYNANVVVTQLNTAQGPWLINYLPGYPMNNLSITDPGGGLEKWHWEAWGNNRYTYTDKRNAVTAYTVGSTFGGQGRITQEMRDTRYDYQTNQTIVGEVINTTYDPNTGMPASIARGNQTTYITYNAQGQIASITDPKNQTTGFTYWPNGTDVKTIVNAQNTVVATYAYNAQHLPVSVTDAAGTTTTTTYTAWGTPAAMSSGGQNTIFNYNGSGQLTSLSRNGATLASMTYDAVGRVKTRTDASNITASYEYNNLDNVTKISYSDGTFVSYDYVCCGMAGAVRDRAGRTAYYDYDAMKHMERMQDAAGRSVSLDHNAAGDLIRLVDASGNRTQWSYDGLGRVTRKTYTDGTYEGFVYNAIGKLGQKRDAQGQLTNFAYDANGNLTGVDYPNMADVGITYNALDKPLTMTDGLGTTAFAYDAMARLTGVDGPFANDTVTYGYDAQGRRSWMKVNGGDQVSYGYDGLSRVQSIVSPAGTFGYSYAGLTGQVAQLQMPNGTHTDYSYDGLGRLTQQANLTAGGANVSAYSFAYDNTNRNLRVAVGEQVGTDPLKTINYGYNSADELTGESASGGDPVEEPQQNAFAYDKMGNRTHSQSTMVNGDTYQTSYTSNNLNQTSGYTSSGPNLPPTSEALQYDENGNLRVWGDRRLRYDDANRLVEVILLHADGSNSHKSEFFYDALSRRRVVREWNWENNAWTPQTEQRFVYDGFNVVQERDGSDAIKAKNVWGASMGGGIGGLLSRSTVEGDFYYHYDGRGNVAQLTDANAQVVARYSYDAFGNVRRADGLQKAQPYRFSTKWQHSASGLSDYGFRFYSPSLGKWINRDPIGEKGGLNIYGFIGNNSVNSVDPDGRMPLLIGLAIAAGVGAASYDVWYQLTQLGPCHQFDWTELAMAFFSAFVAFIGAGLIGAGLAAIDVALVPLLTSAGVLMNGTMDLSTLAASASIAAYVGHIVGTTFGLLNNLYNTGTLNPGCGQ